MSFRINQRVLYTFVSAVIILVGTYFAIQYAKGRYRLTNQGVLRGTGLLSANSFPTGAEVMINGKLVTATDDTIYLEPGVYQVEIQKEGYSPWTKELTVESELVTQTNAMLFPTTPSFTPVTFTGVTRPIPSPDGQKLLFYTSSASASLKNGLYVIDLSSNPLNALQRGPRQIAEESPAIDLATANYIWSPDSTEVLVETADRSVLIDINQKTVLSTAPDIGFRRRQILSQWQEEMYLRERQFLALFPEEMIEVATTSAKNVYFSPDKKKLLYTAIAQTTIPTGIVPPVPATSTQPQTRDLQPGGMYVYDREEDTNFLLGTEQAATSSADKFLLATDLDSRIPKTLDASPSAFVSLQASTSAQTAANFSVYHTPLFNKSFQWLADSRHLIYMTSDTIKVVEYDTTNNTTIYAGPFAHNFVYPWPDGSKLLILTSFSPVSPVNLYSIELRK
jgi:hypothetical protein